MLTDLMLRLRSLVRRRSVERELDEEIRLHLEHEIERYRQTGVPQLEAVRRAHLALGGLEQVKEQCRDARGVGPIDTMRQDLRYAFRAIRKNPGFATMAIVSLALGIGANTAIFTLINAVMLRALPVRSPEELVAVGDPSRPTALWEGGPMVDPVFSYPMYERLRDQNRVFTGLLASGKSGSIDMSASGGTFEGVRGRLVSDNYFDVLGVSAVVGRTFATNEAETPGTSPVVVIGHDFWERRFAGDTGVLGRTIRLNGSPFTIIGVAPRRFTGDVVGSPTDIWIPLAMQPRVNPGHARLERRDSNWLLGMGRLKRGVSIEMAREEMIRLAQEVLIDFEGTALSPEELRDIRRQRIQVLPGVKGFSWIRKNGSSLLFTLMGIVGVVLIIACANVANLLLARATTRQREIAVRLALGASRSRIIRQLLIEGAILAALGGLAGLVLAGWGSRLLSRLASQSGRNPIPFDVDVHPDVAVLAFTAALSVLTAILFGLAPAIRSTRVELSPTLKETTRSLDRSRWPLGKLLVIGQLAVSVPLLIGAGLLVRSLANLQALDVGYSRDKLLLLNVDLTGSGYETKAEQLTVVRSLIELLESVPGVRGITVSENGLFSGIDSSTEGLQVEGFHPQGPDDSSSGFDQVGPDYFRVIGVPLLAGRDFDERDTAGAPKVAVINETMARFYFGTREPVGTILRNGGEPYTIVGVVKDSKQGDLGGKTERRFYISLLQDEDPLVGSNVEIRTIGDAAAMIPTIRRELQVFDRTLNVSSIESVRVLMDQSIGGERSMAQLSGFFGVLALLLSSAGLYGVMSYAMSRRTNEIGLRMALGAGRGDVIRMVLRETLVLMIAGLGIGLPAALGTTRLINAMLVGVSGSDPVTAGGAVLALLVVGLCAGGIPAMRASHIDPVAALRRE